MTRVYVTGVGYVLLIPEFWSVWTYGGQVYRRRLGLVERRLSYRGRWVQVQTVRDS